MTATEADTATILNTAPLQEAVHTEEMVSIRRSEIPSFLVHSAFYRSLDEESSVCTPSPKTDAAEAVDESDEKENLFTMLKAENATSNEKDLNFNSRTNEETIDWEIKVPRRYMKCDSFIDTAADLQQMLSTLRFWGSDDLPEAVARFCLLYTDVAEPVVKNFDQELVYLQLLKRIVLERVSEKQLIIAAEGGLRIVMECVHKMFGNSKWNVKVCEAAARSGSLECLQFAHQHGCPWNRKTCEAAAGAGHILCLRYAFEQGCPWDSGTCAAAAKGGQLECLKYAHEHGCRWDTRTAVAAAESGQLACLQYAHSNQCPWDTLVPVMAARSGSERCLRYAHENNCPWDAATMVAAAQSGHFECLQYAHTHQCPIGIAGATITAAAAAAGNLEILQYISAHNIAWTEKSCAAAAGGGHLQCLQFLYNAGCPWDASTCLAAAIGGHLACLKYAHSNGCHWNAATCAAAAGSGHIACLEYAHENNCPWDKTTCVAAKQAAPDHTALNFCRNDCLRYYHQHRDIFADNQCDCTEGLGLIESTYVRGMSTLAALGDLAADIGIAMRDSSVHSLNR